MSPSETILVRGVNWLGDAVMTTPALIRLREARAGARIVLLTPDKLAGLWAGHPAVSEVVTFSSKESVWRVARRLREVRAGTALILPNSPRSAIEPFLAGIPFRVGTARPWRNFLLTQSVPPRVDEVRMRKRTLPEVKNLIAGRVAVGERPEPVPPAAHHLHQYLQLAAALGASPVLTAPLVAVGADEVASVRERFGRREAPRPASGGWRRILVGLNPGAEYGPAKRWPAERFAAVAVALGRARAWDLEFWVLGGPGDRELADRVAGEIRVAAPPGAGGSVWNLAGATSLRELCAALKACDVVLTNDTGPMHVAAAVGTPVVVPFGSTSWRLTGPGLPGDPRHRFLEAGAACAPCFLRECPVDFRCMTGIAVDRVVREMESVLGSGAIPA